jgi:holliday junction DNA helicase RuvA
MIAYISGKILFKEVASVVIDCGGVGYELGITTKTSEKLPKVGEKVSLSVLLVAREDSLSLYGFLESNEKKTFELLTSVSGIGHKKSLGILSGVEPWELRDLILSDNIHGLSKLPGIGKKTAERIILELKDKALTIIGGEPGQNSVSQTSNLVSKEAEMALVALGYSVGIAQKSVSSAIKELGSDSGVEELIRLALKNAVK